MKKLFLAVTLLLSLNARAQLTTSPGGGTVNSVVNNFIYASGITDQVAASSLQKYFAKIQTMQAYTSMQYQWLFASKYAPSNHMDFFGHTNISWTKEPKYNDWGALFALTNSGSFSVTSSTNWTVSVVKRNMFADYNDTAVSFPIKMEVGVENSNGDGYYLTWSSPTFFANLAANSGGVFPYASNWNNATYIQQTGAKANDGPASPLPPAVWTLTTSNSTFIQGFMDILPLYSSAGVTNLARSITNRTAPNRISLGGSTNFNSSIGGWIGFNVTPTNGQFEMFSVAFWNTNLTQSDIEIYNSAIAELRPKRRWVWAGDSMLSENSGKIVPNGNSFSNCIPYNFALRHPADEWSDYAQGGSTHITFSNQISPKVVTLWPSDCDQTIITDFPRNSILNTNANNNYTAIANAVKLTFAPFLTTGAKLWLYESVLPATNTYFTFGLVDQNTMVTNTALRNNLVNGYKACWTNGIANRYIHGISYWYGAVWDGNTSMFYQTNSGYGTGGVASGGFHIEGTNSPIFMQYSATLVDTGEWVPVMPVPAQIQ